MPTSALIDWSETTGILLSKDIDCVLFEDFLLQLSTDENLEYQEVLSWLLSLRIVCNQKDIVNAYFECFEKPNITEEHAATDKWIWANITLSLECNDNYPVAYPDNDKPSEAERYLVDLFNNQNIINLDVNDVASLHKNPLEFINELIQNLVTVYTINFSYGAAKSSSILIHLLHRYIPTFCNDPALYTDWAYALQRCNKYEESNILYLKFPQMYNEIKEFTPRTLYQYGLFCFAYASHKIDCQDFEDLSFYLDKCTEFWRNISQEINYLLLARLNSFRALNLAVLGKIEEADKYSELAFNVLNQAMHEIPGLAANTYFTYIRQSSLIHTSNDEYGLEKERLEQALTFLDKPDLKFRLDLQLERARLNAALAINYSREKVFSAARKLFEKADKIYNSIPLSDTSDVDYELGLLRSNHGNILFNKKKYDDAIKKFESGLKLLKDYVEIDDSLTATNYAMILANKATAENRLKKVEALATSTLSLKYYEAGIKANYPIAIVGNAKIHITIASVYLNLKIFDRAIKHLYISENIFNSIPLNNRRDLDADRFKMYLVGIKLIDKGIPNQWILNTSRTMSIMMEMKIDFTADGDLLHVIFLTFHYLWISYASNHNLDDVPIALGAIHSRVLSRRMLDQIRLTSTTNLSPEINQIIESRAVLREDTHAVSESFKESKNLFKDWLKASVQESIDEKNKKISNLRTKKNKTEILRNKLEEKQDELLAAQKKQHKNIKFHRKVRQELLNKMPWESSLSPYSVYDVSRLCELTTKNQAIIFLIDLQLPEVDDIVSIDSQIAWICPYGANPTSIKLSLDINSIVACTHQTDKSISRYLTRNGPSNSFEPSRLKFDSWQAVGNHISTNLWDVISKKLPNSVEDILLVTHGRFHLLPSELGYKNRFKVSHFLSMLFLGKENKSIHKHKKKIYQTIPSFHEDLPFSNYESHPLLSSLWSTIDGKSAIQISDGLNELNADQLVDCLHISGHGKRITDRHRFCHINHLFISKTISIQDQTVFSELPSARIVWVSACVLGITEHDKDGDPTGLVMPFLLRGSRHVIACLTPVPDLWMPMLVSLTEWLMMTKNIPIAKALAVAKETMLHDKIDTNDFKSFNEIYIKWLRETCIKWFLSSWSASGNSKYPWIDSSKEDFDKFTKKFLGSILPNLGFTVTKQIVSDIIWINNHQKRVDAMINILINFGMHPPKEVCERLKYSVKLFSSNSSNTVSF